MRPTIAEINLSNLKYNFLNIRKKAKNSKVMAVIKADAYGHGALRCAEALNSLGEKSPDYFGVALVEEAVELRKAKIKNPLLSFAPFDVEDIFIYGKYKIEPTVCASDHIEFLSGYNGPRLLLQVNVDTGMGRLGIHYSEAVKSILKLNMNKHIRIRGVYTHFATSDEKNKKFANIQLERFKKVVSELKDHNIESCVFHAANSGAIIDMPDAMFDMVRPGISLYGYYPSLETSESIKLKPVMSLISKVSTIKEVSKGESVSYGRLFLAKRKTRAATIGAGYADGINRNLSNDMSGIIKGRLYHQIGRVTMDRISFKVDDGIKVGDKVILLGKSGKKEITAWDWAKKLNTIPYEITCNISKRIPRKYD